jgi:predicted nucleic-acid-binding Zn-ribbon protein
MPDDAGKLNDKDFAIVQSWMEKHGDADHACPICGSHVWEIGEHLVQLVSSGPTGVLQLNGPRYPNILLLSKCGYTRMMNAVIVGLIDATPPKDPTEETRG